MSYDERLANIHLTMNEQTGELVIRYEHYVYGGGQGTGWVHRARVVSPQTLQVIQDDWAAMARRNPDMEPETVSLTLLKRWALADVEERAMESTA